MDWRQEAVEAALRRFAEKTGWAANELFMAVRVATTGRAASPPLFETLAVLGKETCRRRLRRAADVLKTGASAR
jgi:glutamyl-tRNA synthetase